MVPPGNVESRTSLPNGAILQVASRDDRLSQSGRPSYTPSFVLKADTEP